MLEFGQRLKKLRKALGLSIKELAKNLNFIISDASICRYENGKRKPRLYAVIAIAKFFNVSLEYLAGLKDAF